MQQSTGLQTIGTAIRKGLWVGSIELTDNINNRTVPFDTLGNGRQCIALHHTIGFQPMIDAMRHRP